MKTTSAWVFCAALGGLFATPFDKWTLGTPLVGVFWGLLVSIVVTWIIWAAQHYDKPPSE